MFWSFCECFFFFFCFLLITVNSVCLLNSMNFQKRVSEVFLLPLSSKVADAVTVSGQQASPSSNLSD